MPTPNTVKFITPGDEELKIIFVRQFHIRQEQGLEAYHFWACVHNDDLPVIETMRSAKTGPMVIGKMKIETSDETPVGSRTIDWNGWALFDVRPDPLYKDVSMVGFADLRYVFEYAKLSGKFNVFFDKTDVNGNEIPDEESLDPTTGLRWTIGRYFERICELIDEFFDGAFPDLHGGLTGTDNQAVLSDWLPKNLGNTFNEAGGWVAGSVTEMLAPISKAFGVTFQMGLDAKFYIVDTAEERADIRALLDVAVDASYIGDSSNLTSRPKQLEVSFEARDEVVAEVIPATSAGPYIGLKLTNVMRVPHDLLANATGYEWWDAGIWGSSPQFRPLWQGKNQIPDARLFRAQTERYIAKNYFKEMPVPYPKLPSGNIAENSEISEFCNGQIASNWRRSFRVDFADSDFPWVRIRVGRLNEKGGTEAAGGVFCDHTYVRRRGRLLPDPAGRKPVIARLRYSESFLLANLGGSKPFDSSQPAPFRAFWSDRSQMIVTLEAAVLNPVIVKDVVVGAMVSGKELGFGTYVDFVADADDKGAPKRWVTTKQDGELRESYMLRIMMNATSTNPSIREYPITKDVFPSTGDVPLQKLKAHGVTANRRFDDAQVAQSSLIKALPNETPVNLAELDEIASRMADEVRKSYLRGKMAAIKVGGVKPLVDGIEAGGECNEMWVSIGGKTEFSIDTYYSIKPSVIEITLGRKDLDGNPVKVTA